MACGNDEQKIFLGETDYQAFNSRATRTFYVNRKICEIVLDDPKLQGPEDGGFFRCRECQAVLRLQEDGGAQAGDAGQRRETRRPSSESGNRLEKLSGNRAGQYSIRINDQWRICFTWKDDGPYDVEIVDDH